MNQNNLISIFKTYIFDFDGTIVDLSVDWESIKQELIEKYSNIHFDNEYFSTLISTISNRYPHDGREEIAMILKKYEQKDNKITYNPILPCIELLKNLKGFYIVSNNLHSTIEIVLKELDLLDRCLQIVGFDDVKNSKPHKDSFNKIKMNQELEQPIVFIGDSEFDKQFANNNDLKFVNIEELL